MFGHNSVIGEFMEFELFTNVTSLINSAFFGSSLTGIKFPTTIVSAGTDVFRSCGNLIQAILNEGLVTMSRPFYQCGKLSSLTIPSTVTSLGSEAFYYCSSLATLVSLPAAPPSVSNQWLRYNNIAKIYVPDESLEAYMSDSNWGGRYASRIHPMSELSG